MFWSILPERWRSTDSRCSRAVVLHMTTSEWTTSTAWVRGSGPVKAGVVRQLILTVHESGAVRRGGGQEFTSWFRIPACRASHRRAARCSGNPQCFPRRGASPVQDCFRCAVLSSHHLGNEGSGIDWRVRAAGASRTGRTVVVRRPSGANRCGRGTDREPFDARAWRRTALFSSGRTRLSSGWTYSARIVCRH